jgi:hypothetical protein
MTKNFSVSITGIGSQGSSVSIVSDYRLDNWAIKVRSPAGVKRIFPLDSVSRPALGPTQPPVQWIPGVKCGGGLTLATHPPTSAEVMNDLRTSATMVCSGTALPFFITGIEA